MRKFLEAIGALFVQANFEVGMGIISAFLASLIAFLKAADIGLIVSIFITVFIGIPVLFRTLGVFFIAWSEALPPKLDIKNTDFIDTERTKEITKYYASLRIINRERLELTDCRAVFQVSPILTTYEYTDFIFGSGEHYLTWKNESNYKTTIPANGSEKILRIYEIEIHNPLKYTPSYPPKITNADFCVYDKKDKSIIRIPSEHEYEIKIVFHGKLNGKEVRTRNIYLTLLVNLENRTISIRKRSRFNFIYSFMSRKYKEINYRYFRKKSKIESDALKEKEVENTIRNYIENVNNRGKNETKKRK